MPRNVATTDDGYKRLAAEIVDADKTFIAVAEGMGIPRKVAQGLRNGMKTSPIQRSPWGEKKRALHQTEAAFQAQVIELATLLGWWCWHPWYAGNSPAGYPDLTMFRERVLFVELKVPRKNGAIPKLSPAQIEMAHRCFKAGAEHYVWYPSDWEQVKEVLSRGGSVVAT